MIAMICAGAWTWNEPLPAAEMTAAAEFNQNVRPMLEDFCYDCHGNGENRGDRQVGARCRQHPSAGPRRP